jgi:GntR family transcriptional regulator
MSQAQTAGPRRSAPSPVRLRYEELADVLRHDMQRGSLQVGDRLPGERELCARFGMSRGTVRRALADLRHLGLVEPAARGWMVVRPSIGEPDALLSFSEMADLSGLEASADVLVRRTRPADPDERRALRLGESGDVFELTRVRRLDGTPVGVEVTRLPADLVEFDAVDFGRQSLYGHLRRHGVSPSRADYEVSAATVSDWEASLLAVVAGTPVLVTAAVTYDERRRPIEISRCMFVADRYRFHATLLAPRALSDRSAAARSILRRPG